MNNWVVLKFGGTSVESGECWNSIKKIVEERLKENLRPVIVSSAVAGISDQLDGLISKAIAGDYQDALRKIEERHLGLCRELSVKFSEIESVFEDLKRAVMGISLVGEASPRVRTQVMATGELMSTKLGGAFLNNQGVSTTWCDARRHLVSTKGLGNKRDYFSARVNYDEDPGLIHTFSNLSAKAIITQGFIAANENGDTVLLGRGGSDASASYFAAKLRAARLEIWTDVPGMYTANPKHVSEARLLKKLSYDEAQEIASSGAKVLHPRAIAPVKKYSIPLHICCLSRPDIQGTVVTEETADESSQVKAISSRMGVTLLSMDTVDMWQESGFLADAFECFKKNNISVDLISTSETNVTVTIDRMSSDDDAAVRALVDDLSNICQVHLERGCALVSLVGRNIRAVMHQIAPALEVFEEQRAYLVTQAANDLNLTFVVDDEQALKLVRDLHGQLFKYGGDAVQFGPTWGETFEKRPGVKSGEAWWLKKRDKLLELSKKETPLYVYDGDTIKSSLKKLKEMDQVARIFYSVKANWNPEVLKTCYDAGVGFECVSPGEIGHLFKLFPKIDAKRILFTPNFVPRCDYELAFEKGVFVTLDNLYPLREWPEVFEGRDLIVRIDPGEGKGHHKYVHTAGAKAKFGVWPSELGVLGNLADACNARVVGLHAHVGSNIMSPDTWAKNAVFLKEVGKHFKDLQFIDVGGGFGVPDRPSQDGLNLEAVNENLKKALGQNPSCEIWIEPGRFIVALAGVLLARVTQTKQKGGYNYIGVDAGMNTLIRPALYGSHHEILNLSRINEEAAETANIVGPICESGDVLGYARRLPRAKSSDVLIILNCGAYGRVMSSSYNMREPAGERFL